MDDEPLAAELDERQRAQPLEGIRRRRQHAAEQGQRHSAQDAGGVERCARLGVEPVEVQRGKLLHDGRKHRVLGRVRPLAESRGGELQGQRVTANEAVDPLGLCLVEPRAEQHLGGVGRRQRAERDGAQQLPERGAPDGARCVARTDHDTCVRRQRREEGLAEPAVEQTQVLRGVDAHHRAAVAELRRDGGEEARGRRLDRSPVDRDHHSAALRSLSPERAQQRRLPRARDAVGHRHDRSVVVQQPAQGSELGVAADHGRPALGQQRSERTHRQARTGSGSGAATIVETTGLIASVGSFIASAWRSSASGSLAS